MIIMKTMMIIVSKVVKVKTDDDDASGVVYEV